MYTAMYSYQVGTQEIVKILFFEKLNIIQDIVRFLDSLLVVMVIAKHYLLN